MIVGRETQVNKRSLVLVAVILSLLVASATAANIGLCNTGTTANCVGLNTSQGTPDLHYSLVAVPTGQSSPVTAVVGPAYVSGPGTPVGGGSWMDNGPNSLWISPTANQGASVQGSNLSSNPPQYYVYETTFTLSSGFTAPSITGFWSTDNAGIAILLNGHDIGASIPYGTNPSNYSFAYWSQFVINDAAWFQTGTNTLDFVVANGNGQNDTFGPAGLRVEFTNATYTAATPEPSSLILFGTGLISAAGFIRRKLAR